MLAFKMEGNVSLTEKTRDLLREQLWLAFAQKEPNETNWAGLKKLLDLPPPDLTLITRSVMLSWIFLQRLPALEAIMQYGEVSL